MGRSSRRSSRSIRHFTGFDANIISLYALFRLLVHVPPKMPMLDTLARVEKLRVDLLNRERECERIERL
jgi:hypothetical protein